MGILERIKEIEAEMARTQKNKATGNCHSHVTKPFIDSCVIYNGYLKFFSIIIA